MVENSMDVRSMIHPNLKEYVQQRLMRMGWKLTLPGVTVLPTVGHIREGIKNKKYLLVENFH